MYLAFLAYFDDHSALRLEAYAVALFAVLALLGLRLPALLILGYALHGGMAAYFFTRQTAWRR
jgi:hypothetical protein